MTTALGQATLRQWVRASGRAWWQVGFSDGRVYTEMDTIPNLTAKLADVRRIAGAGHLSRWEDLPKEGLRALRLLTPIGTIGHLETNADYRLFQLKVGGVSVSAMTGENSRWCDAHIIGKVISSDGDCELVAYDYRQQVLLGPMLDNVRNLRAYGIGPLALDPLGIRL